MKELLAPLHVFANLLQSVRFALHYHCIDRQIHVGDNLKCQIV